MKFVEVTITQTETFTIKLAVPENADRSDIQDTAEKLLESHMLLDLADGLGDCDLEIKDIHETNKRRSDYVYVLSEDGYLDDYDEDED